MTVTAVGAPEPARPRRAARTAFTGPVRWFLVECAHYAAGPSPRGRGAAIKAGDPLLCEVCGETRRVVKPVE